MEQHQQLLSDQTPFIVRENVPSRHFVASLTNSKKKPWNADADDSRFKYLEVVLFFKLLKSSRQTWASAIGPKISIFL